MPGSEKILSKNLTLSSHGNFTDQKLSALGSTLGELSAAFLEIDRKSADLVILDIGGLQMDSSQKTGKAMLKSLRELADLPHEVQREKKFEAVKAQRDVL